jgi:glycogen debranching enzyme
MPLSKLSIEESEEDRYHVAASASGLELSRVLKHGDTFLVAGRTGDIRPVGRGEQGLYHRGTKYASRFLLRLGRQRPLLLSSSVLQNNLLLAVDLTNPDIYSDGGEEHLLVPHGTIHIARSTFLQDGAYLERIVISNYGAHLVEAELKLELDADFADIFEVRGTRRPKRGVRIPAEVSKGAVTLGYRGLDGIERRTRFELAPAPTHLSEGEASFDVRLESHQSRILYVRILCEEGSGPPTPPLRYEAARSAAGEAVRRREERQCHIYTSNEQLNDWINRSQSDLRMLLTNTDHGPYPYAGVPWFSTAFGRDGLWAAIQTLWIDPDIARGVLKFLSAHQAMEHDPEADAEPGKIIHEMRDGEMAALREIPFGNYYGSIDSTPLYLMLAWRYYEATGDGALLEELWPSLLLAMEWIDVCGDQDGDGFVEYGRRSRDGLVQQGWKDSNTSVFHRGGTLATGPIALCEVQGYVYDAKVGMSRLARALGKEGLADGWERQAHELREQFDAAFWCEEIDSYALALDGDKLACRVKTSNAAHCLFTGIALPKRWPALATSLMAKELFSGFGLRTLAADEQRYNPMSYHNGSIWPHDNAIAADGLAAAGYMAEATKIFGGLFDVALFTELHRLPELFCGFSRQPGQAHTQYPVACSPQAWASGAVFMLLKAILGLSIDGVKRRISLRHPILPPFIEELSIQNLRVGDDSVDVRLHRHPEDVGLVVTRATGRVEVVVVK